MKKPITAGDIAALLACIIALLIVLPSCNAVKKYERKCAKAAAQVEKALNICPSLASQDTTEIKPPIIMHDTIIEFWGVDCDNCYFTAEYKDTIIKVVLVKDSTGTRIKSKVTPPAVPCPQTVITSSNGDLVAMVSKLQKELHKAQIKAAECRGKKGGNWLPWVLVALLVAGHVAWVLRKFRVL